MKNIYVSARAGALYINDYTENVLGTLEGENAIFFLSAPSDDAVYRQGNIRFLLTGKEAKKGIRSVTEGWRTSMKRICRQNRPDVFFVHNANPWIIVRFYPLWKKAKKRVLMFWGTDINEISPRNERVLRRCLPSVTCAGFTSGTLRRVFLEKFGEKYADITRVVMFGMPLFDEAVKLRMAFEKPGDKSREACRNRFDIPRDKICVHIGYNAPEAQQHLEILEALSRLPADIKGQLYVLIPFGYGRCEEGYKEEVEAAIASSGIDGRVLPEYLAKTDTAMLRGACDIFVYGRTVDSHSFTPVEYMYMGARVVMPRWLLGNYEELGAVVGYEHYIYSDFHELTGVFKKCADSLLSADTGEPRGADDLRKWIRDNYSWETSAPMWKEML